MINNLLHGGRFKKYSHTFAPKDFKEAGMIGCQISCFKIGDSSCGSALRF
jgi:hypothetical protein